MLSGIYFCFSLLLFGADTKQETIEIHSSLELSQLLKSKKFKCVKCIRLSNAEEYDLINFSEVDFSNALANSTRFNLCRFKNTNFSVADLSGSLFYLSDIEGANFSGANITGMIFVTTNPKYTLDYFRQQQAIWDDKSPPKIYKIDFAKLSKL